jgi:hypothetical protein
MISLDLTLVPLKLRNVDGKVQVYDPVRKRWVVLTPEEHVRQLLLGYLVNDLKFPKAMMSVEKMIVVDGMQKRFDLVVYDREHKPWLLAECKAPDVPLTQQALHQLLGYQKHIGSQYWLLCNGQSTYCADAKDSENIRWLLSLPAY